MPPAETLQSSWGAQAVPPVSPEAVTQTPPNSGFPPQRRAFPKKLIIILFVIIIVLGLISVLVPILRQNIGRVGGQVNLTWWGLWEDQSVVQPLIDEYQAANPNVKVTYIQQSKEDYRERLTSALASGDGPDIFRYHNTWVPMFRSNLAPVPSDTIAPSDYLATFYPDAAASLSSGSDIVGVPLEFDSLALYVNDSIFDTYLKSPPTTWDELKQLAQEMTVKDPSGVIQQAGVALGNATNVDHWPEILALLMMQNQVNMTDPSSENAAIALDYYTRFQTQDQVWNDTLPTSTQMFASGKLAMYLAPSWRAHEIAALNPNLRFHTVTAPQLPKSFTDEPNLYYASYWAEGVSEESSFKPEAFKFLKFMVERTSLEQFYQNAVNSDPNRKFGEPYPRRDMQALIASEPVVGSFVRQGQEAKTWFLQSFTWDGPTGINSLMNEIFAEAVGSVVTGGSAERAMEKAAGEVQQVLAQYGLIRPLPTPAN